MKSQDNGYQDIENVTKSSRNQKEDNEHKNSPCCQSYIGVSKCLVGNKIVETRYCVKCQNVILRADHENRWICTDMPITEFEYNMEARDKGLQLITDDKSMSIKEFRRQKDIISTLVSKLDIPQEAIIETN